MQCVSQVPGLPGAVRRDSFLGKCIQLAIARVAFDRRVETVGIKCFEPRTKSRQFPGGSCSTAFSMSSVVVIPAI
jgi:hypothetical protein